MAEVYQLKYLTGKKLAVFLAAADRIVPPDEASPGGGSMTTAGVVDWALERMDPALRKQFLALMLGTEIMGYFFGLKPFSRLPAEKQDRQLAWMESCPVAKLRMGFFGLKSYVCMGYYTREEVWKDIAYEGPILSDRPFADPVIRKLCRGELEVVP